MVLRNIHLWIHCESIIVLVESECPYKKDIWVIAWFIWWAQKQVKKQVSSQRRYDIHEVQVVFAAPHSILFLGQSSIVCTSQYVAAKSLICAQIDLSNMASSS